MPVMHHHLLSSAMSSLLDLKTLTCAHHTMMRACQYNTGAMYMTLLVSESGRHTLSVSQLTTTGEEVAH